jgi:hypothetical protein
MSTTKDNRLALFRGRNHAHQLSYWPKDMMAAANPHRSFETYRGPCIKWSMYVLLGTVLAVDPVLSSNAVDESQQEKSAVQTSVVADEVRRELLDARDTAWRSFFQKGLTVVERILAPELIAIQQNSDKWTIALG